ncbi:murein biosynthesis integral membrane protein MurJ [Luteimicrobium xylanilyticum]|uniref:Putative peptidoglycan biosynthesis protein MviN n=1 Tax=Luteimicrobium xylanilyticum TaxID=1133546 RepID=A0A5P9Q5B4_9MICO|nr:murein biosynthesis integral membrane protein MurJ [Luteimicrobium xylanilyticum]QFU96529.1 putative peptidoglycan biosynthesis protein MviN [Luteimicrobium xylanilyticum]
MLGNDVDVAGRTALGDIEIPALEEAYLEATTMPIPVVGPDAPEGAAGAGEADTEAQPATTTGAQASLGRSTALMAAGTAVSRVLGLVRNIVLVAAVGVTGDVANAFDVANKLPNILFAILAGGVLNAVLVPQIVRAYRAHNAQERLDKLLTLAGIALVVITAVLTLGASVVVGFYTKGWSPALLHLAVAFAFWCIPQLFFYGIYTLLGQVLNARGQFGPFMWAPVLNNIVAIAGTVVYIAVYGRYVKGGPTSDPSTWDGPQIALLAGTATAGIAAQALILLVPLYRRGFRWRPRLGLHGIGLRSAGNVAGWTFLAVLLEQVGIAFITRFASAASSAADTTYVAGNAVYSQALMIYLLPHSLVTVSIATALFTGIAAAASRSDLDAVRRLLSHGLRTVGVFTFFATGVVALLAGPLTKLLVPSASAADGHAIAQVLTAMAFGLVGLGGMVLMKWVYFAFEDGRTVFWIQVPATGLLVVLSWVGTLVLPPHLWVVGIGVAMAVSNTATVLLRTAGVSRLLHGLDGPRIASQHVRVALATLLAALVGALLLWVLPGSGTGSWFAALATVVAAGVVMSAVYFAGLRVLRVTELSDLLAPFVNKLRRLARR